METRFEGFRVLASRLYMAVASYPSIVVLFTYAYDNDSIFSSRLCTYGIFRSTIANKALRKIFCPEKTIAGDYKIRNDGYISEDLRDGAAYYCRDIKKYET